jgi:hypothetical protein
MTVEQGAQPPAVPPEKARAIEDQIERHRREVKFTTHEYPVETIVEKYVVGLEDEVNELYVPDYQRELA